MKRPSTNQSIKQTKVDYTTSNKASYKEWKDAIKKRTRFGDFHEAFKQSIIASTVNVSQKSCLYSLSIILNKFKE